MIEKDKFYMETLRKMFPYKNIEHSDNGLFIITPITNEEIGSLYEVLKSHNIGSYRNRKYGSNSWFVYITEKEFISYTKLKEIHWGDWDF